MQRHHTAVSLLQAAEETPSLAKLAALIRESQDRLKAIEVLLPPLLRNAITAGPIQGDEWCLLVKSNAAAAKIRNFVPSLLVALRAKGWDVNKIRLKVQANFSDVAS